MAVLLREEEKTEEVSSWPKHLRRSRQRGIAERGSESVGDSRAAARITNTTSQTNKHFPPGELSHNRRASPAFFFRICSSCFRTAKTGRSGCGGRGYHGGQLEQEQVDDPGEHEGDGGGGGEVQGPGVKEDTKEKRPQSTQRS